MFKNTNAFSSFSVDDIANAKAFYEGRLGVDVTERSEGLALKLAGGGDVFIYQKEDHKPATFTVLNFKVDDIDKAVEDLAAIGIEFESYGGEIGTDDKGIFRGKEKNAGPNIAWFKDPAGNFISVLEEPDSQ